MAARSLAVRITPFPTISTPTNDIRPLLISHGLGDTYASCGIIQFESEVKKPHPGFFVHSVYMNRDVEEDKCATFYGNVNAQIGSLPSSRFDAIGFSQGSQFLRGYVERYNDPPIYNLITFDSQHMGISDILPCRSFGFLCEVARRAAKAGAYTEWGRRNIYHGNSVSFFFFLAQYFRDPNHLGLYMTFNSFLGDINNELMLPAARNVAYANNLASLENLILVLFAQDKTAIPKQKKVLEFDASSTQPNDQRPLGKPQRRAPRTIVPTKLQPLYVEDYIGLRSLDDRGIITLQTSPGEHVHLTGCWEDLVRKWAGQSF
ncbi:palmitoyl-protein thioesterase [Pisolithus albus]|nr:palmitoyl-protein thioesterase [Pisolithus albus]